MSAKSLLYGTKVTIDWLREKVLQICLQDGNKTRLKQWNAVKIGLGQGFLSHIIRVNFVWENDAKETQLPTVLVLKAKCMMIAWTNIVDHIF